MALAGRGAGIVTHPELTEALTSVGAPTSDVGVTLHERVAYDRSGARVRAFDFHQVVTSWDRMHGGLRSIVPDDAYRLGCETVGFEETSDGVSVRLADGRQVDGDLLIGADGFRSAVRGQWQPDVTPDYAGYVVWRTVVAEQDLPAPTRADIFKTFGFYLPNGSQIIGYPIAGPDNDLRPGHLRYNFVWYREVPAHVLHDMLTDSSGVHHDLSIPPPLVRADVIASAMAEAKRLLPQPFFEIMSRGEQLFFTPIYDLHAPVIGAGRVALAGDAACTVRPHLGMGVTKAGQDALALARHLEAADVPEALAAYSAERVAAGRIAYDAARQLGRMTFDVDRAVNQDGRSHADMDALMRDTAVVPPALQQAQARSSS